MCSFHFTTFQAFRSYSISEHGQTFPGIENHYVLDDWLDSSAEVFRLSNCLFFAAFTRIFILLALLSSYKQLSWNELPYFGPPTP